MVMIAALLNYDVSQPCDTEFCSSWDMMLHHICCQCYGVEHRRKAQPMFCVSAKPWLQSDILIWTPLSWIQRMLGVQIRARSRTSAKEQG